MLLRLLSMVARKRREEPVSIWDPATTSFRVALSDLDVLRHMNNGKYLTILDVARVDLLMRSGLWRKLSQRGWYPVVAGQTITYRRSLELRQRFDVRTRVVAFDDRSCYMEQTFVRGETICARATVRMRFLKKGGGSVDHDELEQLVGGFRDTHVLPAWMQDWSAATRISEC